MIQVETLRAAIDELKKTGTRTARKNLYHIWNAGRNSGAWKGKKLCDCRGVMNAEKVIQIIENYLAEQGL